jgi:hypothetical protein
VLGVCELGVLQSTQAIANGLRHVAEAAGSPDVDDFRQQERLQGLKAEASLKTMCFTLGRLARIVATVTGRGPCQLKNIVSCPPIDAFGFDPDNLIRWRRPNAIPAPVGNSNSNISVV